MSTGGNVPSQAFAVQEVTTAKKRGDRSMSHPTNYVGKGTPGRNVKRRHRVHMKITKKQISLRDFAERLAQEALTPSLEGRTLFGTNERMLEDAAFAEKWLERK